MSFTTNDDNLYPIGLHVSAKENPTRPLVIQDYYQRIYYCQYVDDPNHKQKAYFERELIPPPNTTTKGQTVDKK